MLANHCTTIILILLFILYANGNLEECPKKCICKPQSGSSLLKLKCGSISKKINTLEEVEVINIASEVISWNLSDNHLTTFIPKIQMIALQKLDLSRNQLTELKNNQFVELPNLKRLDLSKNFIKIIELFAFQKLDNLERLKLNGNQITALGFGTLDPLPALKQLDISDNPLTCDCGLLWLLDWCEKSRLKLVSNPKCTTPASFKGLPLRKLKIGDIIHCKSPVGNAGVAIIQMRPNKNQVVFEGDNLELHCKAPGISDTYDSNTKIEWTWFDSNPRSYFNDVQIENNFLQGSVSLIDSTLRISNLKRNHTGIWNCILISMQGNHSKGITIIVISNETQYCPMTVTTNNKGTYTWPRTIVKYTATVPCQSINSNYDISIQRASYFCNDDGNWTNLNTSMCPYLSETTKIFEQFSKVNSSIIESAKHFHNYTSNLEHFNDVMDLVFAVDTMENYLSKLSLNQIGSVLIDIINNMLELPWRYLKEANLLYQSCGKIVNVTEKIAGINSSLLHKSNIAIEIFPLKEASFSGLKCTWYVDLEKSTERLFYCVTNNEASTQELRGKTIEASVTIPETLFHQLEPNHTKFINILVSMHATSKLFPLQNDSYEIKTAIVGSQLVNRNIKTPLTSPIVILLRTNADVLPVPVHWDWTINDWSTDGCQINLRYQDQVEFYCYTFSYYGLMTNKSEELWGILPKLNAINYIGCLIIFTSFIIVIVTYLLNYNEIQMPKKAKHSLINTWVAITSLCFVYVFGIHQTRDREICQIIGMLLHYFTLSSLLWMCVGVNCMYNRLSKNDLMELQDDELNSGRPIKKPIIGLYFVGWGIAIIICGISAAINVKEYTSNNYCFLRTGPPLSALYIPTALIFGFIAIFFLLIKCAIYNLDSYLSEGTQATENVDLDLLEPNFHHNNSNCRSIPSVSSKTSERDDPEHAPTTQLKSYIIFLGLYIIVWLSCALSTAEPHFFYFASDLFSIIFLLFAIILSSFTIFFYCISRSDVRGRWTTLGPWLKKKLCFRSRNVSDTNPQIQVPIVLSPVRNSLIQSRSSSRSSNSKSNKSTSLVCRDTTNINNKSLDSNEIGTKINNINLIILHKQQYWSNLIPNVIENPANAAEVFYNAHQNVVARKFFKRQKRHMMKRNHLPPPPIDEDRDNNPSTSRRLNSDLDNTEDAVSTTTSTGRRKHRARRKLQNLPQPPPSQVNCRDYKEALIKIKLSPVKNPDSMIEYNENSGGEGCSYSQPVNFRKAFMDQLLDRVEIRSNQTSTDPDSDHSKVPTIYVNFTPPAPPLPSTNRRRSINNNRASVSNLDDLQHQRINHQKPKSIIVSSNLKNFRYPSLSDSNINSSENLDRPYTCSSNTVTSSDNIETTV